MIICQTYGLLKQLIQLWSLQNWIAMTAEISVALIVGHYEHDVGARLCQAIIREAQSDDGDKNRS